MNPAREKYYRCLFALSSVYDVVLGILFIFFYKRVFEWLGISEKLPAFGGYISLIGAFLLVIGVAYCLIARGDLRQNRDLILVGVLYKLAYCATAFCYFAAGNVPHIIFVSLFGVVDFIFFVLMAECAIFLRRRPQA
jgi:hypothetical protein